MTTVIHCRHAARVPWDRYVYVGRPSKWGNPFIMGRDGTRLQVIARYREWFHARAQAPLRVAAVTELRGKVLGCWCAPKPCHGDVIAAFVEEEG